MNHRIAAENIRPTRSVLHRAALQGFISAKLAIVIAAICGGVVLLAYEWRSAHPPKTHDVSLGTHQKAHKEPKEHKDAEKSTEPKPPKTHHKKKGSGKH